MQVASGQRMDGFGGGMGAEGMEPLEGMEPPGGMKPPEGEMPPEGMDKPGKPNGMEKPDFERPAGETKDVFSVNTGANYFQIIH